jgi:hypothetical protein
MQWRRKFVFFKPISRAFAICNPHSNPASHSIADSVSDAYHYFSKRFMRSARTT